MYSAFGKKKSSFGMQLFQEHIPSVFLAIVLLHSSHAGGMLSFLPHLPVKSLRGRQTRAWLRVSPDLVSVKGGVIRFPTREYQTCTPNSNGGDVIMPFPRYFWPAGCSSVITGGAGAHLHLVKASPVFSAVSQGLEVHVVDQVALQRYTHTHYIVICMCVYIYI